MAISGAGSCEAAKRVMGNRSVIMENQQAMKAFKRTIPALTLSLAVSVCSVVVAESQVQVVESQPVGFVTPDNTSVPAVDTRLAGGAQPAKTAPPGNAGVGMLLNELDSLRQEVAQLRGIQEEQQNKLEQLQQEQRDRYLELDRRISRLNGEAVNNTDTSPVQPSVEPSSAESVSPVTGSIGEAAAQEEAGAKVVNDTAPDTVADAAYEQTIELVRERKFDQALAQLKAFSIQYPDSRYADNVQYWLGEVYIVKRRYEEARDSFITVLQKYPESNKVPDATYKLGTIFDKLGDQKLAKEYLETVIKRFPNTSAAQLSETYLRSNMG